MLFDSHAHYEDPRFDADRDELLASMPGRGVSYIVNIGCDAQGIALSLALAGRHAHVWAAVGIHPHEAGRAAGADFAAVEAAAAHPKALAVGEIGLDYHYDFAPRDVQKQVFARQMALAQKLKLPVCIHDREAHADSLDIVRAFPGVRGVFHSYSGSLEYARDLLKLGYVMSFNGIITFPNAKKFAPIIAALPAEAILIETDCPYLAPHPFRGRRNDSGYLYRACEQIAEIRGISVEEAAALTTANARRFYGI